MSRDNTWITAMEEVHSHGVCTSYIAIRIASAIDDLLASEQVIWTFFRSVGNCTGLQAVPMESITCGKIGSRDWVSEQDATVGAGVEECTNNEDHE
jgi:hypothetical protein